MNLLRNELFFQHTNNTKDISKKETIIKTLHSFLVNRTTK